MCAGAAEEDEDTPPTDEDGGVPAATTVAASAVGPAVQEKAAVTLTPNRVMSANEHINIASMKPKEVWPWCMDLPRLRGV